MRWGRRRSEQTTANAAGAENVMELKILVGNRSAARVEVPFR